MILRNKKNTLIPRAVLAAALIFCFSATFCGANAQGQPRYIEIADSYLSLYPSWINYSQSSPGGWVYEQGLIAEAVYRVYKRSGNTKYFNYVKKHYDYFVQSSGNILTYDASAYRLDDVCPGRALISLHLETGTSKYKLAVDRVRNQLRTQPRTPSGGFWHKNIYPNQMWLDGLYMAAPFYTSYSLKYNDSASLSDVIKQFELIVTNLRDSATGLYYHGWDEAKVQPWANPQTGRSASFWGRAMGWYIMALLDVIEMLPENNPKRPFLISTFQDLCASLLPYRHPQKKLWYQVVDQGTRAGNYIETSASLMFTYAYLRGANKGLLASSYHTLGQESFTAVLDSHTTRTGSSINLLHICQSAGLGGSSNRDGTFAYYISEPQRTNDFKGYGPFILAALELSSTDAEPESIPTSYAVLQAYPNPFNPGASISFTLPENSEIRVSVYDMLGREISVLAQGLYNKGSYRTRFEADDLASGAYIVVLKTKSSFTSKKLIFIK